MRVLPVLSRLGKHCDAAGLPSPPFAPLLSYFGNHSDASGLHYDPTFTSGYALLKALLQLQPEVMEQLLEQFLEGQPFKTVRRGTVLGGLGGRGICWGQEHHVALFLRPASVESGGGGSVGGVHQTGINTV